MNATLPNLLAKPDEPNLYEFGKLFGEPNEKYHACEALSRTKLEVFRYSPLLYWKTYIAKTIPKESSDALIVGQAVDTLALEGEAAFAEKFTTTPEETPKRPTIAQRNALKKSPAAIKSIEFWEAFDLANKGKLLLTDKQLDVVKHCADALHSSKTFQKLLVGNKTQVTFRLKGATISMQCRPDIWCEDGNEFSDGMPCIVDLKTIAELPADDPEFIPRHIQKFGYHRGAFLYPEIVAAIEQYKGSWRPPFILAFAEKQEPYAVTCRVVDGAARECGQKQVNNSIEQLVNCLKTGEWPEWWNEDMAPVGVTDYYLRKEMGDDRSNLW